MNQVCLEANKNVKLKTPVADISMIPHSNFSVNGSNYFKFKKRSYFYINLNLDLFLLITINLVTEI